MSDRTILPPKSRAAFIAADDVSASISGPDTTYARRFSLSVAEDALQRMGPAAVEFVTERLAKQIANEQRGEVERVVHDYLRDRAWAEPIIREAIRDAVRLMLAPHPPIEAILVRAALQEREKP